MGDIPTACHRTQTSAGNAIGVSPSGSLQDLPVPFTASRHGPLATHDRGYLTMSPVKSPLVESNAGAVAAGPWWILPPHLWAGASIPVVMPGFLRALIEPDVRFSRIGLSDGFHSQGIRVSPTRKLVYGQDSQLSEYPILWNLGGAPAGRAAESIALPVCLHRCWSRWCRCTSRPRCCPSPRRARYAPSGRRGSRLRSPRCCIHY